MDRTTWQVESMQVVACAPEVLFAFLADVRNELPWHAWVKSVTQETAGPIGQGTRFHAAYQSLGDMEIDIIQCESPRRLRQRRRCASGEFRHTYILEPARGGTWFLQHGEFIPHKAAIYVAPLMELVMRWHQRALVRGLERELEARGVTASAGPNGGVEFARPAARPPSASRSLKPGVRGRPLGLRCGYSRRAAGTRRTLVPSMNRPAGRQEGDEILRLA